MLPDFQRDDPTNPTYQEKDCRKQNYHLSTLLSTVWNFDCIQDIKRVDQQPDTFGWQAT